MVPTFYRKKKKSLLNIMSDRLSLHDDFVMTPNGLEKYDQVRLIPESGGMEVREHVPFFATQYPTVVRVNKITKSGTQGVMVAMEGLRIGLADTTKVSKKTLKEYEAMQTFCAEV